ncbi:MAG: hypothetical protein LBS55_11860 [Prevotellaceae bacterium]|jgi:hypothetical protein|nr:hypothetical protein [Prevotellaceae bacterium]
MKGENQRNFEVGILTTEPPLVNVPPSNNLTAFSVAVSVNNANGKYFAVTESGKLEIIIFNLPEPKIHVFGHCHETAGEMIKFI